MSIKKTLNIIVPFVLLAIVFGLLSHAFFDISKITLVKYIMTQCLVIMLPGMVCVKYLFGQKEKSIIHWITLSYALGYSINIIEYIIIWGFNLQRFASALIFFVTVVMCYLWFNKPIDFEFDEIIQNDYVVFSFFMVYMIINIIAYSGNNISPEIGVGGANITRDLQFWCSNAVSLKKAFLPETAYLSGTTFFYHYFSSMHIAFMSQISGITIFDVAFTLYSFGKSILLIGSLNYLIDQYRFGSIKYLFYLSILFMTGWELKAIVIYTGHLTYRPFGFDIGLAYEVWLVALLLDLSVSIKMNLRQFVVIMLFWVTLSGTKGPIAVLLLVIAGFVCFRWLFQKRYKEAITYGIMFLGIFLVINTACVGIIRILNHTAESQVANIGGFRTIYEVISETPFELRLRNLLPAMIWLEYNTHPFFFIVSSINTAILIYLLISKKIHIRECFRILVLLFTFLFGLVIGIFYIAGGRSEMYFTMAAYIPWLAYNLEIYKEISARRVIQVRWGDILYKTALLSASIIGLYCWSFTDELGGIINSLSTGHGRIVGNWGGGSGSNSFTKREADACAWIRDNTPHDSMLQSNRFIIYPAGSYFVSIFSERIQYIEDEYLIYYCDLGIDEPNIESRETARREEIVINAFNGDREALNCLIDEGVDYFIQDNLLHEDRLLNMGLAEVYNYDDIVIYAAN